jgi:hypothetical protein
MEDGLTFTVDSTEVETANKWIEEQKVKHPTKATTLGERFSYAFMPTGLGIFKYVIDARTGEQKDITNFDDF